MLKNYVSPLGAAGFSVLKEARGFKGSDENKSFSQGLIIEKAEGLKFVDMLQAEANKLHAKEIEQAKMRGKNVRYNAPIINYKELPDGSISLNFKRKESDGAPVVVDEAGKAFTGFLRREHQIQVAFKIKPYVMATVFGVTLQLTAVKVMDSELTAEDAASIFGAPKTSAKKEEVNVSDLF